MTKLFEDEKIRTNAIHQQEITTTTKNFDFKYDNLKKQQETQLESQNGLKKTNTDLTSMSDNVRNNLDELKCILSEIKF